MIDFRERKYISRFSGETVGLVIHKDGVLADPDGGNLSLSLLRENESGAPTMVFNRIASRVSEGTYEVALTPADTDTEGLYTLVWFWLIDANDQEYRTYAQIGQSAPDYDSLSPGLKTLCDLTWVRFEDLYDSPGGGPNLLTYFQSHFGRNRIAQLMRIAVGTLNTIAQPTMTYSVDPGGSEFPLEQWGALLERQTYVEVLKHLRRSYTEIPQFVGSGAVSRLDRSAYMDRWGSILQDEQADLRSQMEVFKISHMGLGHPRALVSGGVYGRFGPTRIAGSVAARPRYWTRWY